MGARGGAGGNRAGRGGDSEAKGWVMWALEGGKEAKGMWRRKGGEGQVKKKGGVEGKRKRGEKGGQGKGIGVSGEEGGQMEVKRRAKGERARRLQLETLDRAEGRQWGELRGLR